MSLRWPVVIFDLDGTLVDTIPLIVASTQHTMRVGLGIEVDEAKVRANIGRSLADVLGEFAPDRVDELRKIYVAHNVENLPLQQRDVEGVPELLDLLLEAGAKVGVATSKRRSSAQLSLDVAGIEDRVEVDVALDDTDTHKPDPTPLLLALEKLDAKPAETVYVGDAVVDVLAAKAAGLSSIAVTWGAGLPEALAEAQPDGIATTIDELRALLFEGADS